MAYVYYADPTTRIFAGSHSAPDSYQLKPNESFNDPSGLRSPVKLSGRGWVEATEQEHEAFLEEQNKEFLAQSPTAGQPSQPATDSVSNEALNVLGQQLAQVQAQQATLASSVNALGQMVAKAQAPKQA